MKFSLSYYIVLFVLKLKGIKKNFSEDPINVMKVRRGDVIEPKGKFFREKIRQKFNVLESEITEVQDINQPNSLLIFIPGGAFISGPAEHHWEAAKTLAQKTKKKIWMVNYPKSPEKKIDTLSKNIDAIYQKALSNFKPSNIVLLGDSAGATLITGLVQRLSTAERPQKLILISPVMDSSMSNPEISALDELDPMLSQKGVLSAKKLCAGEVPLTSPLISPLYGDFSNFPPTLLFAGTRDIMFPDEMLAVKKLTSVNAPLKVVKGEGMPHIWPILPIMKESKQAMKVILDYLD